MPHLSIDWALHAIETLLYSVSTILYLPVLLALAGLALYLLICLGGFAAEWNERRRGIRTLIDHKDMAKTPYIEDARLKHLLKVTAVSGESPARNLALLTTIYGTGMMLTEVAKMPLKAYLKADGSINEKSAVAAEIAYNGKERPLWWSNMKVVDSIDLATTASAS